MGCHCLRELVVHRYSDILSHTFQTTTPTDKQIDIMGYKSFKEFDVNEVAVWVTAIGMSERTAAFLENGVDGKLLVELTTDDLKEDLGFTGLSAKKFLQKLDFAIELTKSRSNGGDGSGGDDGEARIAELEAQNETLRNELTDLMATKARLTSPGPGESFVTIGNCESQQKNRNVMHSCLFLLFTVPVPVSPAPAPVHQAPPPQQQQQQKKKGPSVLGGAAVGAAGGAAQGAIVGAILPGMSARDGAKAGAAVGGLRGGLRRLGKR